MSGIAINADLTGLDGALRSLGALALAGRDLTPAMRSIGTSLVASTKMRFEDETGPDGQRWTPSRRAEAEGGVTLTLSGHLKASITRRATKSDVAVGTSKVYGRIHQLGDETRGMPARPYLGLDDGDRDEIKDIISRHLARAVR